VKLLLPVSWFTWFNFSESVMTDEEEKASFVATFRKSFRGSVTKVGGDQGKDGQFSTAINN
jgi:hypothetical protein